MLFSSSEVAAFVNATFEPAWESLRPVPTVTIDFGNGRTVTRTLHGNIATYVCGADGAVVDVLPGIYTPGPYVNVLAKLASVSTAVADFHTARRGNPSTAAITSRSWATRPATPVGQPTASGSITSPANTTTQWNTQNVTQFGIGVIGGAIGIDPRFAQGGVAAPAGFGMLGGIGGRPGFGQLGGGVGKLGVERPTELVLVGRNSAVVPPAPANFTLPSAGGLATSPVLALDTVINETERRRMVHTRLAAVGRVTPDGLKKWLFKEVLHADLDDPTLGLKDVLDANYPFADEDRKAAGQ